MSSNEFKDLLRELNFWRKDARKWKREVRKARTMTGLFTHDKHCLDCGGQIVDGHAVNDNAVCKVCGKCYLHHKNLDEIYDHADLYRQLEDK